jgi:hypothetical protein
MKWKEVKPYHKIDRSHINFLEESKTMKADFATYNRKLKLADKVPLTYSRTLIVNQFAEDFAEQENAESKKTAGLILKENKSLITQNKALINELHKAIETKEQEAIDLREKIENLSIRYYTTKVNMTPELMKRAVLEIFDNKLKQK